LSDVIDRLLAKRHAEAEDQSLTHQIDLARAEIVRDNSAPLWRDLGETLQRLVEKNNKNDTLRKLRFLRYAAGKYELERIEITGIVYPVASLTIARSSTRFWEYWIECTPGPFADQQRSHDRIALSAQSDHVYMNRASDGHLFVNIAALADSLLEPALG
jgi:hypothetical protein